MKFVVFSAEESSKGWR